MADWTPAYLDYGERVLTREENIKFNLLGGLQGMERAMSAPQAAAEPQTAAPAQAAPSMQTVILQVGRQELGRVVYELNNEQTRRIGVRLTGVDT